MKGGFAVVPLEVEERKLKLPKEGLLWIPKKGDGIPSYYSGSEKALFVEA